MSRVDRVFNFEVEGTHNFFANGILTHNCHHYAKSAPGWFEVTEQLKGAAVLGLTATPERGDGSPLGDLFDCLIPVSSIRELQQTIDERTGRAVLVPCVTYAPDTKVKALSREPLQAYQEHGAGERAFVFCATVAHAEMVAQTFRDAGIPAATIHADTPWSLRRARVEAFKTQDCTVLRRAGTPEDAPLVLANCNCLTEGVDVPEASVCILARGCGHPGMMLQMVGRVLRNAPGKERAILWDLRGVHHDHGLPEADREYSLEGDAIVCEGAGKQYAHKCKLCGASFITWKVDKEGNRSCPACSAAAPEVPPPVVVEREVFEFGTAAPPDARIAALDRFAVEALDRAVPRKLGWIFYRYRDSFGSDPDWKDINAAVARARKLLGIRINPVELDTERAKLTTIARSRGIPLSWVERKLAEKFGEDALRPSGDNSCVVCGADRATCGHGGAL